MTAGVAFSQTDAAALAHPLTHFGFGALLAGAARPRPGALAFADRHDGARTETSYADLYQRVGACLARLRGFDLGQGEKVLICCPPGAQSFVTLAAALAGGLEPVLAPLPLPMACDAVARAARELNIAVLLAPAQFCGIDLAEPLLAIAARAPSIRIIGALAGALDDAADLSSDMAGTPMSPRARLKEGWSASESAAIGALDGAGAVDFLSQGALLGAALDLLRLTREAGEAPILSLAAPSNFGALVAGPLAALLAGAPLHYLAPFAAARLLDALDALGPVRLVAPAVILPDLARAGLLTNGAIVAVTALFTDAAPAPQIDAPGACPIVELRIRHGRITLDRRAPDAPAHVRCA